MGKLENCFESETPHIVYYNPNPATTKKKKGIVLGHKAFIHT